MNLFDMNAIGLLILIALVANYAVATVVGYLNLSAMRPELPNEFSDTFDDDSYKTSQRYTRAKTQLGMLSDSVELIILIAFWLAGGFPYLNELVLELGLNPTLTGIAFVFALLFVQSIIGLPFSIYATFVLENRYGFNRTTPRTFVLDRVKGVLLAAVLGAPLLAAILLFFSMAGEIAWLYCWIFVTLFSLVMHYLGPTVLMPLFNKFDPLEEGELRQRILKMAAKAQFPIRNVFVIDGSKRSSKSNAFFTGFGKQKRIALFDTLVEQHSEDELVAVLAHEIGHYKKKHIVQGLAVSIAHTGVLFFLLSLVLNYRPLFEAFYVSEPSVYAGLVFFGLLLTPIELLLGFAMNALSRHNEFEADRYAAELTGSGEDLVTALKGLSRSNLANLTPHPAYVGLYYSHPPVLSRIRALRDL